MPSFLSDRKNLSDADVAELKKHIGDLFREELKVLHDKVDALHAKFSPASEPSPEPQAPNNEAADQD